MMLLMVGPVDGIDPDVLDLDLRFRNAHVHPTTNLR